MWPQPKRSTIIWGGVTLLVVAITLLYGLGSPCGFMLMGWMPPVCRYLASRHKQGRLYHKVYLESLRNHYGPLAFDTVVPDLAPFERAVTDRIPITLHAPGSRAAGIARRFFDEVESRLERYRGGEPVGRSRVFKKTAVGAVA